MKLIHLSKTLKYLTLTGAAAVLVSCSGSKDSPSDEEVAASLKTALPPYLDVSEVETDAVAQSNGSTMVKFKAIVEAKDDLFVVAESTDGIPLISRVQSKGDELVAYGEVMAKLTVDKWHLTDVNVTNGLVQAGRPRGSFPSQYLVAGSSEAKAERKAREEAARARQAEYEAEMQRIADAERKNKKEKIKRMQQMNEQRIAETQRIKKMHEQHSQKLRAATAPGKMYEGILTYRKEKRQVIKLRFLKQDGFIVKLEAQNPSAPSQTQSFVGELSFGKIDPGSNKINGGYLLNASSSTGKGSDSVWSFYHREGNLKLYLAGESGDELAGEANMGYRNKYTLRLQAAK